MQATTLPATEDVTAEALAEELMLLMGYVFRASGTGYYALVAELDLSFTQIKTLHVLDAPDLAVAGEEVSVNRLADSLGLSLPAASRTVEGLLQRGYLERREDPEDRRVKRVRLTNAGADLLVRLNRERIAGLREFTKTLSPKERKRISAALAPVLERDEIAGCRPRSTSAPSPAS